MKSGSVITTGAVVLTSAIAGVHRLTPGMKVVLGEATENPDLRAK